MDDKDEPERFDGVELAAAIAAGHFEEFVHHAFRSLDEPDWKAFGDLASSMHRAGTIDILSAVASSEAGSLPYSVQQLLTNVLPDLDIELSELLASLPALSKRWRGEGIPYYLLNIFSEWCDRDEARVDAALAAIREGSAPAELLIPTLSAGMRAAEIRYIGVLSEMLTGASSDEANAAAFVLGHAQVATSSAADLIGTRLALALEGAAEERSAALFGALLTYSQTVGSDEIAIAAVKSVSGKSLAAIRVTAANAIFLDKRTNGNEALLEALCGVLRDIAPGEEETIEALDHALYRLIGSSGSNAGLELLEHLLREEVLTLQAIDSTAHRIRTVAGLFDRIAADWLVDGAKGLVDGVHDLIMLTVNDPPRLNLDFSGHGLSAEQAAAAGRRAIASLILFPVTIVTVLLSLLRTGPRDAEPLIEEMLLDPLLISYWHEPKTYLVSVAPNEPPWIGALIGRALEALRLYIAAVEEAGLIAEFRPSERHRFIVAVQRQEEQQAISKQASKGALASLFPTSVLLYGDSAVGEVHGADGNVSRQEFRLGKFEYSQEIARLDVIDPIGFWYQRILFSMGKAP